LDLREFLLAACLPAEQGVSAATYVRLGFKALVEEFALAEDGLVEKELDPCIAIGNCDGDVAVVVGSE
jgi:hypothetical protein